MQKRNLVLVIAVCLFIDSCNKQKQFVPVYDVPAEFQPYIARFEQEAAKRGYNCNINNLIIKYDASLAINLCAQSNTNATDNNIQKIISINTNTQCWQTDAELETLLFHEIGHCFLGKLHDTALLPNGNPKSIMVADNIQLYNTCVYPIDNEPCDQSFKRIYYIDELFNEHTPVPEWAK